MTRDEAIALLTAPGQPHELETVTVAGRKVRTFRQSPPSLRALYASTVTDLPFLVHADERLTFREAWQAAGRVGRLLVDGFGIAKGDRVAIAMRNHPEWILAFTAITSIGAIAVAVNALWQGDELAYALADSGARLLFADDERIDRLQRLRDRPAVPIVAVRSHRAGPGIVAFPEPPHGDRAALTADDRTAMPAADIDPDDGATIFYTSGSTGHPKGVVSTHRNILAALLSWELDAKAAALVAGIEPPVPAQQAATLLAIPLFHVTGSHAVYLMSYRLQRRLVVMVKWDPEAAAALIARERITSFVAPAAMTGDLVRIARGTRHDLGSLLSVGGGGAPRAPEQVRGIDAAFANAAPGTGWGMTETNAIGTVIGGDEYLARPASSGRCAAVLALRIVDAQGRPLPPGERGELLVRGTSLFRGYWSRDGAESRPFEDGWFRTGDVAYLDDEGYLFIVDRLKDLIIRGGENIGCGQVEAALLRHPDVHEAAVYGVPDERLGEAVGATVHGAATLDAQALRAFLRPLLPAHEIPRDIVIASDPLPRTPSGKILKRTLRDAAWRDAASPPATEPPPNRSDPS